MSEAVCARYMIIILGKRTDSKEFSFKRIKNKQVIQRLSPLKKSE